MSMRAVLRLSACSSDARAAAPRQELRIQLDAVDELEHLRRCVGHEHALLHAVHVDADRVNGARARSAARRPRRMRGRTNASIIRRSVSIVENRKAFHDYFIEERFEAGIALEGWEVKAIRGGRANLKEAYVVVKNGELMLIGAHISPLHDGVDARASRSDAHAQAAAAPRGDQPADRQGRARRLHADAARPALQQGPRQAGDRPRQGQEAARQARDDQGARMEPRAAAAAAGPRHARRGLASDASRSRGGIAIAPQSRELAIGAPVHAASEIVHQCASGCDAAANRRFQRRGKRGVRVIAREIDPAGQTAACGAYEAGTQAYVARFSAITCDQHAGGIRAVQPAQLRVDAATSAAMVERLVRAVRADARPTAARAARSGADGRAREDVAPIEHPLSGAVVEPNESGRQRDRARRSRGRPS